MREFVGRLPLADLFVMCREFETYEWKGYVSGGLFHAHIMTYMGERRLPDTYKSLCVSTIQQETYRRLAMMTIEMLR